MKLILPLLFILLSCAPPAADRYHTGESDADIISLLNEREYDKAIWLIEQREPNPTGELAYLLGQAYLGRAGIEPLAFAAKVTAEEPDTEASRLLFPKCPKGKIDGKIEMKCMLKRVYLHAPPSDQPDFARARALLRSAYPDAATAPVWVNTLIGLAETISLVRRAGDLFMYSKGVKATRVSIAFNANDAAWLKEQGKASMFEAKEALARANHSGEKVSRFLSGTRANEWFERIEGTVDFAKTVGLSRFLDFVRDYLLKPSDEIRYGEALDQLRAAIDLIESGK